VATARETDTGAAVSETYRKLNESLRRGVFPPGSRLPGERDLAASVGVSRSTLRQALSRLAEEGQLDRSSQRGWFVPRQMVGEPPSTLQSFSEMARARGLVPQSKILLQRIRPATFDEAHRLRVAPAARVLELRRLRSMDAVPICVDTSVIVLALVPGLADLDMTDLSLYETVERLSQIRIARSSYTVRADASDEATAALLEIPPGAPILVGEETTYSDDGTAILTGTMSYRADAYRFEADLFRPL
jgi:GntR family transcriptional regulator